MKYSYIYESDEVLNSDIERGTDGDYDADGDAESIMENDSINDLDKKNDGAKEMKELQDEIGGNDINRTEIYDAQDAEFGPDDNINDIMESAIFGLM